MFDIGWSELLVIGVVLIVVVGPKDLPRMLRTFGKTTTQLKRMAGDFRKQFDEALREAELDEVRDNLKSIDPTKDIRKAMNPIRAVGDEIRSSLMAATKAPEPKIPAADAPATPAEPSIVGNADMQPLAAVAAAADTDVPPTAAPGAGPAASVVAPAVPAALATELSTPEFLDASPVAPADIAIPDVTPQQASPVANGGNHVNGKDASGDSK